MTRPISISIEPNRPPDVHWEQFLRTIASDHRFLTGPWYSAWEAAYLPLEGWVGPLVWLVLRHFDLGVVGILPLAQQRLAGLSAFSLGGYYWPFRAPLLHSVLAQSHEIGDTIVDCAEGHLGGKAWRLGPVPRGDQGVECMIDAFRRREWLVLERPIGETHAVRVGADFAVFERETGKEIIKKANYYERRLRRSGNVDIRTVPVTGDRSWGSVLDDLGQIESRSWVAATADGKRKFVGPRNRLFWENVVLAGSGLSEIRPMVLYVDNRPISYSMNIDCGQVRYILANGYDEEFASNSPGVILAHHVMRDAAEHGRELIEWGCGDSGYKSRWGAMPNLRLVDLLILPRSLIGHAGAYLLRRAGKYENVAQ